MVDDQLDDGALADPLNESLHTAGLIEPHVTVCTVNEIARHDQTGKTTRFITLQQSSSKPPL